MSKHGEYFILEQQIKDAVIIFSKEAGKIANTKLEIFQTILANPDLKTTALQKKLVKEFQ